MFGFSLKKQALLGIDIGATGIRLLELSRRATVPPYRVEHFALESLPAETIVDKRIADVAAVGRAIRTAVVRSGTRARRAAVAVSGSSVITKVINMPGNLKDAELESQIELEADQYIPYPLEEVRLDFNVLGPAAAGMDMVEVLLAASRRENVDERVGALEAAGLTPAIVDVEAYAIENACTAFLLGEDPKVILTQTLAIVDIGSATTTLYVMHGGKIVYTREQNFGGRQLIDEVQRRYGFGWEEAAARINTGEVAEDYDQEVLGPFREALAQQIGRALQFFYSGTTYKRVEQVFLAGSPAAIPRIDTLVEERLNLPVSIANPFTRMTLAPAIREQTLMREAPGLLVAVGLALRGFD